MLWAQPLGIPADLPQGCCIRLDPLLPDFLALQDRQRPAPKRLSETLLAKVG